MQRAGRPVGRPARSDHRVRDGDDRVRRRRLAAVGAGGQVTRVPAFMPAMAVSRLAWMSAGSLRRRVVERRDADAVIGRVVDDLAALGGPLGDLLDRRRDRDGRGASRRWSGCMPARPRYDWYWSTSTPMALILAAQAASMTPLPVLPATWKRTSMPGFCLMNCCAERLAAGLVVEALGEVAGRHLGDRDLDVGLDRPWRRARSPGCSGRTGRRS